jgi:hypothetical protein
MKKKGYQEVRGGGLEVLLHAWNSAATGWKNLDDAVIDDSLGKTGTSTNQDLSGNNKLRSRISGRAKS